MNSVLQVGGTVIPGNLYVERPADSELLEALKAGEFCYVLAPRQIGKSSLRVRCQQRLSEEGGHRCATIDLTDFGKTELTKDQWFYGFLESLCLTLQFPEPKEFWRSHDEVGSVQRWSQFLRKMLDDIPQQVVIFVDEIDTLLELPGVSNDFFAAMRALYNKRADDPTYQRLSFCLLGVATPGDLIKDATRTPFNIGRPIRLEDFTRPEIDAFIPVLVRLGDEPKEWLDAVYEWTTGHPYFTQLLCEQLLKTPRAATDMVEKHVARCVQDRFLLGGRTTEANLSNAEKRLSESENKAALLFLYRRLLKDEHVPVNQKDSIQFELQLCGLCAQEQEANGERYLRPRNLIYKKVFGLEWVKEKETRRFLTDALQRWNETSKRPEGLLRGSDLEDAQQWASTHAREITHDENEFLIASMEHARQEAEEKRRASEATRERENREHSERQASIEHARQEAEEKRRAIEAIREREKREHSERQTRTQRRITYGLVIASILFVILGAFSFLEYKTAEQQQRVAAKAERDAENKVTEAERKVKMAEETVMKEKKEADKVAAEISDREKQLGQTNRDLEQARKDLEDALRQNAGCRKRARETNETSELAIGGLTTKITNCTKNWTEETTTLYQLISCFRNKNLTHTTCMSRLKTLQTEGKLPGIQPTPKGAQ